MSNVINLMPYLAKRAATKRALEAEIAEDMALAAQHDLKPIWDEMLDEMMRVDLTMPIPMITVGYGETP